MTHSHDIITKSFLNDLAVAKDFLNAHLPESVKTLCDLSTLRIEPGSFVEESLRSHTSDILYSFKMKSSAEKDAADGKEKGRDKNLPKKVSEEAQEGLIYCLVEAQSTPDKMMPLRMLRYQTSALKRYAENNKSKPLPVIIPLLFYTGSESPYPESLNLYDCFNDPQLAKENLLNIHLIDLSALSDEQIKEHGLAAFLELIQKHIRARDLRLAYLLVELLNKRKLGLELYRNMLYYIFIEGDVQEFEQFLKILIEETKDETYKEGAMTIADHLREEGYKKGIHAGIEQGIEKGELDAKLAIAKNLVIQKVNVDIIKQATGLSDQELAKLSKNH